MRFAIDELNKNIQISAFYSTNMTFVREEIGKYMQIIPKKQQNQKNQKDVPKNEEEKLQNPNNGELRDGKETEIDEQTKTSGGSERSCSRSAYGKKPTEEEVGTRKF